MDTAGFLLVGLGAVIYFWAKSVRLGMFLMGTGAGIVIGAVWSYFILAGLRP